MKKTITNPVIKDQVTFTQTAHETNGRISTLLVRLMPGGGTPLHYHKNFSETFIVVEGELTLTVNGKAISLTGGQKITVEKGIVHRFSNGSAAPVTFTTVIVPGSTGFENSLRILYGLASDGKTDSKGIPKNILTLVAVSKMSDMHPVGIIKLFAPLFGVLNQFAQMMHLHEKLTDKYCR